MDGGLIPRLIQEEYDTTLTRNEYKKKYLPLLTIVNFEHNLIDFKEEYYLWKTESRDFYKINYDFTVSKIVEPKESYKDDITNNDFYYFNEEKLKKTIKITDTIKIPYYYFLTQRVIDILQVAVDYSLNSDYLQKIFRFQKETNSIITISGLLNPLNLFIFIGMYPKLIELLQLNESEIETELKKIFTVENEKNKFQLNNIYDLYQYHSMYIKAPKNEKSKIEGIKILEPAETQLDNAFIKKERENFTNDINNKKEKYFEKLVKEILELKTFLQLLNTNTNKNDFDKMFLMAFFYYRLQKKELLGGFPINLNQQLESLSIEDTINTVENENIYNQKKPVIYEYSMTNYNGETYGNCMENTILQFIKLLMWNSETMNYENIEIKNEEIKDYLNKVFVVEKGINQKTQSNIDKWTSLITPIEKLTYYRNNKELISSLENFNIVLKNIFGKNINNIKDISENIESITISNEKK